MRKNLTKKNAIVTLIIIGLIIIDQILKIVLVNKGPILGGFITLTYVENPGVAFGFLPNSVITIILANLFILYMLARFMIIQRGRLNIPTLIGGIFILAGGISNLLDRIFRGYVVDYISITDMPSLQVINFADVILIIGWIIIVAGIVKTTINLRSE